jgi:hypothetical protein
MGKVMKINPININPQIYSPIDIRRERVQQPAEIAKIEENQSIKNLNIDTINNLNKTEKVYFSEAYEGNQQVQLYLKSGGFQNFGQKGQHIDLRG